jgi:hypothetical protein
VILAATESVTNNTIFVATVRLAVGMMMTVNQACSAKEMSLNPTAQTLMNVTQQMVGFLGANFVGPTQSAQIPLAALPVPVTLVMKILQIGMDVLTQMSARKDYPIVIQLLMIAGILLATLYALAN